MEEAQQAMGDWFLPARVSCPSLPAVAGCYCWITRSTHGSHMAWSCAKVDQPRSTFTSSTCTLAS